MEANYINSTFVFKNQNFKLASFLYSTRILSNIQNIPLLRRNLLQNDSGLSNWL